MILFVKRLLSSRDFSRVSSKTVSDDVGLILRMFSIDSESGTYGMKVGAVSGMSGLFLKVPT